MIIRELLDFAIDFVADKVGSNRLQEALHVVLPHVLELANVDRFDEEARLQVQSRIDDALRAARLI